MKGNIYRKNKIKMKVREINNKMFEKGKNDKQEFSARNE